jgi:hypothetical protein
MTARSIIGFSNGMQVGDTFATPSNTFGYGFGSRTGDDQVSVGVSDTGASFNQLRQFYDDGFCRVGTAAPSPGATVTDWLPRRVEIADTGIGVGDQSVAGVVLGGRTLLAQAGFFVTDDSGGLQSITGVGFQPEMLFLETANTASIFGTENSLLGIYGVCDENLDQWAAHHYADFFFDTNQSSLYSGGVILDPFGAGLTAVVDSLDADGFTLDWVGAGSGAYVGYLALADPHALAYFRCGVVSPGIAHTINTLPRRPQAVMFMTTSFGPLGTVNDDGIISMGAASPGGVQACCSSESKTDLAPGRITSRSQRLHALGFELESGASNFLTVNTWTNDGFQTSWDNDSHFYGWAAIRCSPDVAGGLPVLGVG